jgi:hypothetical protein
MAGQTDLESFVGGSFRSVWAIEVLTYLAEHRGASFSPAELIAALRVSDAVIVQSIDNLAAVGLAVTDSDGRVALFEGDEALVKRVQAVIDLYRKSPDKVRRLIVAQAAPGVTAFADAFKLRKD